MTRACKVLVADPPWPFADHLPGNGRGAAKHYPLMSLKEIALYPIPRVADDAWLFLWRVAAQQEAAFVVCRAWGFQPYTEIVWQKLTPAGKPWFGMGRLVRGSHESILVGRRGRPGRRASNIRSSFSAVANRHSEKPGEFYDLIERLVPGPYTELFARRERPGWNCVLS